MLRIIISLSKINKISQNRISEKLLVFLLPIIILGMSTKTIIPSLINIVFCLICIKKLEIPFTIYRRFVKGISLFVIMGGIPIIFIDSLNLAVMTSLRSFSSATSVFLLSTTTPMDSIFYELNRYSFFKEFSEIGRSMLRFIILMEDEFLRIKNAMDSRFGFANRKTRLKNFARVLALLLINMMKRWEEMENSLISRGYRGSLNFTFSEKKKSRKLIVIGVTHNLFLILINIIIGRT